MIPKQTGEEKTARRGAAGARSERARRAQARVAAAVEADYLAQLGRDLRLTTARAARTGDPCLGGGA